MESIEYRYIVHCGEYDENGFPNVDCLEVYEGNRKVGIPVAELAK